MIIVTKFITIIRGDRERFKIIMVEIIISEHFDNNWRPLIVE